MFDPVEIQNSELLAEVGPHGHFPPSEQTDLGTHSDLIDRLWKNLNSHLESDCRWIVGFRPALTHPKTGVAFAFARGTNYYLRITGEMRTRYNADLRVKALTDAEHTGVEPENLDQYLAARSGNSQIGPSWATGWFLTNEVDYVRWAYENCK